MFLNQYLVVILVLNLSSCCLNYLRVDDTLSLEHVGADVAVGFCLVFFSSASRQGKVCQQGAANLGILEIRHEILQSLCHHLMKILPLLICWGFPQMLGGVVNLIIQLVLMQEEVTESCICFKQEEFSESFYSIFPLFLQIRVC